MYEIFTVGKLHVEHVMYEYRNSKTTLHTAAEPAVRSGKVQNMDPRSMDPLRGPGPWTGSIKIWTGSMDQVHGPGP